MDFTALLEKPGHISPSDVINFRMDVFSDGLISLAEAEAVFAMNTAVDNKCDEWVTFFVESIVDFTVNQAQPQGYVSVANAEWLIDQITADGKLGSHCELELLIRIVEKAQKCPQKLCVFALEQLATAVVDGNGPLLNDKTLVAGVIGSPEVELLRRILYANGGEGSISVSKAEAEVLFDLNDQTVEAKNHSSWSDLFMKAVANHLMAVSGYQSVTREEALRREEWLDDQEVDVSGALANSLRSISSFFSNGTWSDIFKSDHQRVEEAWADRNEARAIASASASQIDDREARWLVERIGRDGVLHENEKALLNFIREESPMVHPSVRQLLEKSA